MGVAEEEASVFPFSRSFLQRARPSEHTPLGADFEVDAWHAGSQAVYTGSQELE